MNKQIRCVLLVMMTLGTIGCASARLQILSPLPAPERHVALRLYEATDSKMTGEQRGRYQSLLTSRLSEKGVTVVGGQSYARTAMGTVTTFNPGSRVLRYMIGFGAGRGTLDSRWNVVDQTDAVVGACRIKGSIAMGVFGGSFDDVLEKSGDRLAEFLTGEAK